MTDLCGRGIKGQALLLSLEHYKGLRPYFRSPCTLTKPHLEFIMDKFLSVQPGLSVYHPDFGSRISLNKISYWLSLKTPESKIQTRLWSCAGFQKKHPLLYFQAGQGPSQSPGVDGPQGPGGRESKAVHLKHMVSSGHRSLSDQPALYVAVSELRGGKRGLR